MFSRIIVLLTESLPFVLIKIFTFGIVMYPHALMQGNPPLTTLTRLFQNHGSLLTIVISVLTFGGQG